MLLLKLYHETLVMSTLLTAITKASSHSPPLLSIHADSFGFSCSGFDKLICDISAGAPINTNTVNGGFVQYYRTVEI